MSQVDYVLRRAAAQYKELGLLTTDMMMALSNAGLLIEDIINFLEEKPNGEA